MVYGQQISTHWLRHTTLTWVERNFGYAVARAYAGHSESGSDAGTTITYVRASLQEVAVALAALTNELRPSVGGGDPGRGPIELRAWFERHCRGCLRRRAATPAAVVRARPAKGTHR